ncbi:hypothetical protein NDU88_004795 [Pleurodeles waltl]|uniref:Uncharacterized protein n=1 Tax=Pleurodeles waltl TaxID=8319 RepID=A0AAV7V4J7_PLEWA|nr:hypothetical protein NDU88_004788 [Pleurodeles waltl]KAJ1195516.1 hypothetical protein NDU88_004795 [Pleurodeles waltl]
MLLEMSSMLETQPQQTRSAPLMLLEMEQPARSPAPQTRSAPLNKQSDRGQFFTLRRSLGALSRRWPADGCSASLHGRMDAPYEEPRV